MGRNRKDSYSQLPIDQYRKQIGKQDNKKTKNSLKESKDKALIKKGFSETYKIGIKHPYLITLFR